MAENGLDHARHIDIVVAVPEDLRLTCGRCEDLVLTSEVAFYTRTQRAAAFEPWCAECALQMVEWAEMGATGLSAYDDLQIRPRE